MRNRGLVTLLGLVLGFGLLAAGCGSSGKSTTEAGSGEVFVQAAGEIFLEPAGTAGPESFAGDALLVDRAVPSPTSIPAFTTLSTIPGTPVQLVSYSGGTPGLYGGSRSKLIADKDAQLRFLQANLDKARAFCAALNADATLRWSGGTQVQVEQLAAYFAELTPVLLARDIRVTNHGYRDGKPTPRQSVLQAGQMILVDAFGVPRARCQCGNPLIPPIALPTKPKYTGTPWPGFDPTAVIVVQQTTVVINTYVLIDVDTGLTFERPVGSSGATDAERTTTTTMPATTATSTVTITTTLPQYSVYRLEVDMTYRSQANGLWMISWAGEITINPDGSLSGELPGLLDTEAFEVTASPSGAHAGSYKINAPLGVAVGGHAESTAEGRTLHIQQTLTGYQTSIIVVEGHVDPEEIKSSIEAGLKPWIEEALTNLVLPAGSAPVKGSAVVAGRWQGSANLLPIR